MLHHRKPEVVALRYDTPDSSFPKILRVTYTIITIDFASRYCIIRGNSANTRPNLKTYTRLVGIPIQLPIHILNIQCNRNSVWLKSPKILCHMTGGRPHSSSAISLVDVKKGVFDRGVPGVEKSWY